ncbi:MAG TPA: PorV/PorQ family protein [Chitinophagales bacterium]|nr:PorV/PorQ family protein [Chitinophagales bacterium]
MKRCIIFLLLLTAMNVVHAQLLPSFGGSRTGTTGFQFLKIAPDARSVGMGGSFMATVDDVAALYWNPAGITKTDTQNIHLQLSQTLYFADVNMSYAAIVHQVSKQTFLGASIVYLATGPLDVTTEFQPFGTGQTFNANDVAVAISLGRILTDNFRFGITGKYIRESFAEVHADNAVVDFGFQYEVGVANTRFAVGVANFGFNTEPSGEVILPTFEGFDTIQSFEKIGVPAIFRIGIAWDPVKITDHRLTVAGQLNHPTDNNETYNLGAEYAWRNTLFCRSGYEFGLDEQGIPNFGFGVRFKRNFGMLQLDYGFEDKSRLGSVHRFTFSASFF